MANYTFECFYPGQDLSIRINAGGWLHRGAIVCPPCQEICGEEFAMHNQTCKFNEEAPPSNMYPKDDLKCNANHLPIPTLLFLTITGIMLTFCY